jgi:hypothetical protein
MFANCQLGGEDHATPDVCKVPPGVPQVFNNVAKGNMAIPNQTTVFIMCMPQHNLGTIIPITNGDNPGTDKGVASGTVMERSKHITGVSSVVICGQIATRLTSQTLQNKTNAQGARVAPSQQIVVLLGS